MNDKSQLGISTLSTVVFPPVSCSLIDTAAGYWSAIMNMELSLCLLTICTCKSRAVQS